MKKQIVFFASLLFGTLAYSQTPISVYDCQVLNPVVTPTELNASMPGEYHKSCVLLDEINSYSFSGNDNLKITASESIELKENFHAGSFLDSNGMHLAIEPEELGVYVMNYSDLQAVERFGKLELAIEIPQNIDALVQDFVDNGQSLTNVNPFDPEQLEIKAYFQPLYNGNWYSPFIGHGFYYENYKRSADTLNWDPDTTMISNYRIRFAPRVTGLWRCLITVYCPVTGQYKDYKWFTFNVVDVGLPDFMRVSDNKKYFKVGSEPFYPFGMNLPTQGRATAYSTTGTKPKDFVKYFSELRELSDAGANYFRYMNQPYSTEIEFDTLGDYSDRMNRAWEMDQLIDSLPNLGLRMHYCLTYTLPLTYTGLFSQFHWDWSKELESGVYCDQAPNGFVGDPGYCYHSDPTYGVETIDSFFTDPDLKKFYKNRLRYYVSRWGYSTHIGTFELMNEINFSGVTYQIDPVDCSVLEANDDKPYFYDVDYVEKIYNWQSEMCNFIKDELEHPEHLLATHFGGPPNEVLGSNYDFSNAKEDGISVNAGDYSYQIENSDIRGYSEYDGGPLKFEWMSGEIRDYRENFNSNDRPFFFTELGTGVHGCDDQHTYRQLYIMSPFCGAAGAGLPWEYNNNGSLWDSVPERLKGWSTMPPMKDFLNGVDLTWEEWYNDVDVREDLRAEAIYLRNNEDGANKAIGVINNRSINRWTMRENWCDALESDCDCYISPEDVDEMPLAYKQKYIVGWSDNGNSNEINLDNMGSIHKYIIKFYDPYSLNLLSTEVKWTGVFGNLTLKHPTLNNQPDPGNGYVAGSMVLFKAYRESDGAFIASSGTENELDYILPARNGSFNKEKNLLRDENASGSDNTESELILRPNPASDEVVIQLNTSLEVSGSISITDIYGKIMYEAYAEDNIHTVDVSPWKSGIYYVYWIESGVKYSQKLLIL